MNSLSNNCVRTSCLLLLVWSLSACLSTPTKTSDNLYGKWIGKEYFKAYIKDQVGNVPEGLLDDEYGSSGTIDLILNLAPGVCSISKMGEPPIECKFDVNKKKITVPGGVYGADYEPGYKITGYSGHSITLNSELWSWPKEEDYSYTYYELANALLIREEN